MYMCMVKSKDTIVNSLIATLKRGEGDWEELAALLDHVKEDVEEARKAEEAREAARKEAEHKAFLKRGEEIAEMATRVLENKTTADDVACVMNSYLKGRGLDANIKGADISGAMDAADEFAKTIEGAFEALKELFDEDKPVKKVEKTSADDVLRDFLRTLK